jgi:hypothetical protein
MRTATIGLEHYWKRRAEKAESELADLRAALDPHPAAREALNQKHGPAPDISDDAIAKFAGQQYMWGHYAVWRTMLAQKADRHAWRKRAIAAEDLVAEAVIAVRSAYKLAVDRAAELYDACTELNAVRRQNQDLLAAKAFVEGALFCGFEKGEPIQKTGGDYDADALFVCAFEWEGVVRFVGAIPQKRGFLFFIFNPKQVKAGSAPAATPEIKPPQMTNAELRAEIERLDAQFLASRSGDDAGHCGSPGEWMYERINELETELKRRGAPATVVPAETPAPRRFRHRKRGSIEVLIGEAEMLLTRSVSEDATLTVCRRKSDNRLVAKPVSEPGPDEQLHTLIGFALLQSERTLGGDGGCSLVKLTIYRGESDGKLWARPTAEFNDGRFEELPPAPGVETAKGDVINGR